MSFRELRNFTEMMRALGYPRLISVDNFRTPNFELVADSLYWMVKRYDPDIIITDSIETENDRVEFLTSASTALLNKAHIMLNAKRLYAADGNAVRELLKLATVLYSASRANTLAESGGGKAGADQDDDGEAVMLTAQLTHIKEARAMATEITEKGALLFDLLSNEKTVRRARLKAMAFLDAVSGNMGMSQSSEHRLIDSSLREIIANTKENIESLQRQCDDLVADEKALSARMKKRQAELERNEKRLKSLATHRPAFADEFDKLEGELGRYYEVYMERLRNLDYLEHELEKYNKAEDREKEEYDKKRNRIAVRIRKNELKDFIGREPEEVEEGMAQLRGSRQQQQGGGSRGGSGGGERVSSRGGGNGTGGGVRGNSRGNRSGGGGGRDAGGAGWKGGERGGSGGRGGDRGKVEGGGGKKRLEDDNDDSSRSSSDVSGSDLQDEDSASSSSDEELSLNGSEESESLIDDDEDESSGGEASGSDSNSADSEAF